MSKSKRPQPRELTPAVDWDGIATHTVHYDSAATIFGQGDPAPSIMYVETGTVRLSVLSHTGKEAVVAVLDPGHFFGEGCMAGQSYGWPQQPRWDRAPFWLSRSRRWFDSYERNLTLPNAS